MDLSICHIEIIKHPILYPSINNIASDFWIIQYINNIKWSVLCHDGLEEYITTSANFDILHIKKGCHCVSKFASLPENVNYSKDISLSVNVIKNELKNSYWPKIAPLLHINTSNPVRDLAHLDRLPTRWKELEVLDLKVKNQKFSKNDDFFNSTWSTYDFILNVIIIIGIILLFVIAKRCYQKVKPRLFLCFLSRRKVVHDELENSDLELDSMVPPGQE